MVLASPWSIGKPKNELSLDLVLASIACNLLLYRQGVVERLRCISHDRSILLMNYKKIKVVFCLFYIFNSVRFYWENRFIYVSSLNN